MAPVAHARSRMIAGVDPRLISRVVAAGRIALGAGLLVRPELLTVPWIGRDGRRSGARVLARAVGARDLALGAGALTSGDSGLERWLQAAVLADATDFFATVAAGDELPAPGRVLVGATALSGALLGAGALAGLRRG